MMTAFFSRELVTEIINRTFENVNIMKYTASQDWYCAVSR